MRSKDLSQLKRQFCFSTLRRLLVFLGLLAGLLMFEQPARAHQEPPGCSGSGLGISLFTSAPNVHIGDAISYNVLVFNTPFPACNAGEPSPAAAGAIRAFVVTPDGVTNQLVLQRTFLAPGESDYYTNVVSYVVRVQDIRPDGTLRATAFNIGDIHQNDLNSTGGGFQGVNTEVSIPCIQIHAQCVGGAGENGVISFTGTVTNCGNDRLVGVTVTNVHEGGVFQVLSPIDLAVGQVAPFSGTWTPANPCAPSTATLTAHGSDALTASPKVVTSTTTVTCQNTLAQGIVVTKACSEVPVRPGGQLVFTGSVSNTGNVTLMNVVVVNDQPAPNTPVFNKATLAPGEVAHFEGAYTAPTNCSSTSTVTATASTRCGVPVSDSASSTCPIQTFPGLVVTESCPAVIVAPGALFVYTGTVRNSGDISLTNVVVLSEHPAPNTVVFTAANIPPGAVSNFTASFTAPLNVCSVSAGLVGAGRDVCSGIWVTNTTSMTCPLSPTPQIAVSLNCPANTVASGAAITYHGIVSNIGNITLTDVVVVNNQPAPSTPVFSIPSLAPGASAPFEATFTTPANSCSVSSTVTAWGVSACGGSSATNSASATCPLLTAPKIVVTRNCPVLPVGPGGVLHYEGRVSNTGDVTLTNIVVVNDRNGATPVFTAALLEPGQGLNFTGSYTVPNTSACAVASVLTATGQSQCGGATVENVNSTTCPVTTAPSLAVTLNCPSTIATAGGPITYTGTVLNTGNSVLTNVTVVNNHPAEGTVVATIPSLAPGVSGNFTATFTTPANTCLISSTVTAKGVDDCSLVMVTDQASVTCPLTSNPLITVTQSCPANPVETGGTLVFSGVVSNPGDVTLTNIMVFGDKTGLGPVFTLAVLPPGGSAPFTGSFTTPLNSCSVTSTLRVSGQSDCSGLAVTNAVTTTCPLKVTPRVVVTLVCPEGMVNGGDPITYHGVVSNAGDITLNNVTVVSTRPTNGTPVLTVASLAPGASAAFTATFVTPLNACSVSSTVTASGVNSCGSDTVTDSASATCPLGTAPRLVITQDCPITPVGPGDHFVYSGSLSNEGSLTLTNLVVVDTLNGGDPVFAVESLPPGASTNFLGGFMVPLNSECSVSSALQVTSHETCGGAILTNTVSTTCLLNGVARLVVHQTCPEIAPGQGGILAYSGTVSNAGTVTLTNVVVVNNRPATNTVVLTVPIMRPGAVAEFKGSYVVPANCCVVWSTVTATGGAPCTGVSATDTYTATCPVTTIPGIVVTKECPAAAVGPGDLLHLSGIVSNSGNITLLNVNVSVVPNSAATGLARVAEGAMVIPVRLEESKMTQTPVLTWPITLAPGEAVRYLASYRLTADLCGGDTVTATGADVCKDRVVNSTVTSSCAVTSAPAIVITRACPSTPIPKAGVYTYTATVTNTGNSTLVDVMVFNNLPAEHTRVFGPITMAPGAGVSFSGSNDGPRCCCYVVDTLTAVGIDLCTREQVYNTSSLLCPLETTPGVAISLACPAAPFTAGTTRAWSGYITNIGNANLTNVMVIANYPAANTPVRGPLELAPGEVKAIGGTFVVPADIEHNPLVVSVQGKDICKGQPWSAEGYCGGTSSTAALSLTVVGNGTVSGAANGQALVVGRSYTLTATPLAGARFLGWSGGVSGTNTAVTFVMTPTMAVIANFSSSAGLASPGVYTGLFYDTNGVVTAQAGYFSVTLRSQLTYSGSLRMAGKSYSVSGALSPAYRALNTIQRSGMNPLQVFWDFSTEPGVVVGAVGDGVWASQLLGDLAGFNSKTNPCPLAGMKFTLVLPGTGHGLLSPQGDGYGKATVDSNGNVSFNGMLADGTSVSQKAPLSASRDWPLYVSLNSGKGSLLGWLQFVATTESDISGKLSWIKPVTTSKFYPNGFDVQIDVMGSRYIAPASGGTALTPPARVLILEGGNLPANLHQPITLLSGGKVNTGLQGLSMSISTSDGYFSGSYKPAGASKSSSFKGAILQKANTASGYLLGTNQSGRAWLDLVP